MQGQPGPGLSFWGYIWTLALGEGQLFQLALGFKEKTENAWEILFPLFSSTNQHDHQ